MIEREIRDEILSALKKHSPKRVLVQAPEGLKTSVSEIAATIENQGTEAVIWAEPCFGACDIPDAAAKSLGCDMILHIGHAPMGVKSAVPVSYIECRTPREFSALLEKNINILKKFKKIGILTTVQHISGIRQAKAFLEKSGIKAVIGKSKSLKYPGQVLGCDAGAAKSIENKVDAFLFLGSGKFHAFGILKKVDKPVLVCDFEMNGVFDITHEKGLLERKRIIRKCALDSAKRVGVLVSTKRGQMQKTDIFALKKKLESQGKSVKIVAMDHLSPDKILGMNFDILINCACPRIGDDLVFRETVVNMEEIM